MSNFGLILAVFTLAAVSSPNLLNGQALANGDAQAEALARAKYTQLPLAFEKRSPGGKESYVARGLGYEIFLQGGAATIALPNPDGKPSGKPVELEFANGKNARAFPGAELPGKINIIHGNDESQWQLGLHSFQSVRYADVYDGIDVVYYGNQQQLEFDLIVKPGADPGAIILKVAGAEKLSVDDSGALNLLGASRALRVALPQIYQEVNGRRKSVAGHYAIIGDNKVAFRVDRWDRTKALVIDPTIVYSALSGGGQGPGSAYGVKVDGSGNIIVAGYTLAADFPTKNAAQGQLNGSADVFVSKFNPAGAALIYSTFIGGAGYDFTNGLALDSGGSAWVTGYTRSSDFPLLNAAQVTYGGNSDAFVLRLDSNGALQFSTYLGGSGADQGTGVAVDSAGNGYVTGYSPASFPTTAGVLQSVNQGYDAFVAKYSPTGSLGYSTLLGGASTDIGLGIAADSAGNAYVTGYTFSTAFTGAPAGGAEPSNNGKSDAFVAKLNATGTGLLYFTFLGGPETDEGHAIAIDGSNNAYIAGKTNSTGLATAGAAQGAAAGLSDGFVAKLNGSGSSISYFTYVGGRRQDSLTAMALDGSGNVYLTGSTQSADLPTVSPLQPALPGTAASLIGSTNSGGSWSPLDFNITGLVFDFSINPASGSEVVLTEAGISRTANGGTTWNQQFAQPFSNSGSFLSRSPATPGTIYAIVCCSTIFRSSDDGVNWSQRGTSPGPASGILADPLNTDTVYLYGFAPPYINKSTDGGVSWTSAATGLPSGTAVNSIVSTSDGTLYAGTAGQGVYKSTNQGASWVAVNTGLPQNVFTNYSSSLAAAGSTVYLAADTIYKTVDGGANWTAITGSVHAFKIAVSQQNTAILYALTTANSVEKSTDGGATWSGPLAGVPLDISDASSNLLIDSGNGAHIFIISPVNTSAFVSKLNSSGSAFTWLTYLGGIGSTSANAIATDGAGNAVVTGYTTRAGFPLSSSAPPSGSTGIFLTRISDATAACSTLSVSPGSALAPQNGGTLTFSVVAPSGCAWTASSNQGWAVIAAGSSGTGTGIISVQIPTNSNASTGTAILTVGSQSVTITQPSNSCIYTLDQSTYQVAAAGGTVSVGLTAPAGCPWSVTNIYPSAVTIPPSSSQGSGSATLSISVSSSGLNARQFQLGVGTAQINISQPGNCTFNLSPLSASYGAAAATSSVTVTPSAQGCTWSASSNAPWLTITSGSFGNATGTGTLNYAVATNAGSARSGQLLIAGIAFPVNQAGPGPQTISFGAIGTQILGNAPFTLNASASSGLPVSFASNSNSVCTVSGVTVTLVAAGTCSITATQAGDGSNPPAPSVTVTFTVDPAFGDVNSGDYYNKAIDLMLSKGITSGCSLSPFNYCPQSPVTRGQMAVFIVRSIFGGNNFTYNPSPYFTDVPVDYPFFKWIQKMKDLGITNGCSVTTYCPDQNISRGQMAVFIMRARYGTNTVFNYPTTPFFSDVPADHPFFKWVQRMKQDNITSGCGTGIYCPDADVIRGDMAIFLMRGSYNQLLPPAQPIISSVLPTNATAGTTVVFTITGSNTNFVQGTTTVSSGPGTTIQTVTVNTPTTITVQIAISAGAALGPRSIMVTTGAEQVVLPNGLTITSDPAVGAVAYWTGDNTVLNSISGKSAVLTNGAGFATAPGRSAGVIDQKAISLNGTNSYVQAAADEPAAVSGARTLVAWVYPNASSGPGMPVLTGGQSGSSDIFGVSGTTGNCSGSGQYRLYLDHQGAGCYISNLSLAPNTWSLVAVAFDGTNATFYINGVAATAIPAQMYSYGLATYQIGGNTLGGTTTGPSFNGLLNEIQVYSRALSAAEIQGLYKP